FDSDDKEVLTYGRMFAPAIGIQEDPVTGNANGPLGGYLIQNKIIEVSDGTFEFIGRQGESIHRIGQMKIQVSIQNHIPEIIRITGNAISVFRTVMQV
uniref:PhzF family phenazine biosynthesis protein n=1 Tax=Chryseobacterium sp. TaxID=1871047 RepID=UPI00321ACA75